MHAKFWLEQLKKKTKLRDLCVQYKYNIKMNLNKHDAII